ncbi:MAG: phosphatase [Rhodospirillales bacterium]|nr:phosphatase [Rhodospirillales bacterium]
MTLRGLIFDVDGTLADTEEAHRHAFNAAFREAGLDWQWDRKLYCDLLLVTGGKERLRHYVETVHLGSFTEPEIGNLVDRLHRLKTRFYLDAMATGAVTSRPGVSRLLTEARGHGLRLAIATTTSPANVMSLLERTLGSAAIGWFEVIAAGDSVRHKKPSPEVYLHALERMRLKPNACLAFEDSANGLAASLAAGIATIVTPSSFTARERFSGALAVLSDLGEPDRPFRAIEGESFGATFVDAALLRQWHRYRYPAERADPSALG